MANFKVTGGEAMEKEFGNLANAPRSLRESMLTAMGEATSEFIEKEGRAKNVYDPEWSGKHVLDSLKVNKPKITDDGGSCTVTFSGSRKRGNTTTRNAEIAFVNEYGANRKNIRARQFVSTAMKQNEEKIVKSGQDVFDDWLNKNT